MQKTNGSSLNPPYKASLQSGAAEALAEGGISERDVPSTTKLTTEAQLKLADLKQKRAELLVETTAVNTAISLAQTGAKILIVDADMRRPASTRSSISRMIMA